MNAVGRKATLKYLLKNWLREGREM